MSGGWSAISDRSSDHYGDRSRDMSDYLVIGGAGRTGRHVVELLLHQGHGVTVASRRPGTVPDGARPLALDLAEPLDPGLLDGVTAVVVTVETPMDDAGSEALMHRGVAALATAAARAGIQVVLVSQIYITRAAEHPELAGIIRARAAGEEALRTSGAPYTIVRPSWLTNDPAGGVRLEQGDTGDGRISRESVARAVVAALGEPTALGKTFELYDGAEQPGWPTLFATLEKDTP
jgi:uncharacterized protein YbjT (DUF2867 family)